MTFSLSVFMAMVLLLPGLALFAGMFASGKNVFRASPPPPASFTALTIVITGACLAHMIGFAAAALGTIVGAATGLTIGPSPYAVLVDLAGRRSTTEPAILSFLLMTLALAAATGLTAMLAIAFDAARAEDGKRGRLAPFFYGWLAEIVVLAQPLNRYVNAYVLCEMEFDGSWIGYQGTLDALTLSSDKEVVSILLRDAGSFRLAIKDGKRDRELFDSIPIERLQIAATRIINIAFEVYELPSDDDIISFVQERSGK